MKFFTKSLPITWLVIGLLCGGCASIWQVAVSLTETVESAGREYAHIYNQGLVSAAVDAKVTKAYEAWQKSAGVAAKALRAYQISGDSTQYDAAFRQALLAANGFVDLIVPFFTSTKAIEVKTKLSKASKL